MRNFFLYAPLFVILLASYLYGIHYFPLRGEEANRILTAYEMVYFGDFFNLTHLGEPYYLKPPLFMYLVALFSHLFGWYQESARLISVVSSFLTAILAFLFYKRLFGDTKGGIAAALLLLTFGDLALFYGFLAEIDAFHMFLFTFSVFLLFELLRKGKTSFAFLLGGFLTALLFLTKGFPAFYHLPVSFLLLLIFLNRWKSLFSLNPLRYLIGLVAPLAVWFLNLKEPQLYLWHLWMESFSRTPLAASGAFLKHLLTYPLLNLKQLLPNSLFLANFRGFRDFLESKREVLFLVVLILVNYLPYLISPGARGRYILILFPFIALLLTKVALPWWEKELKKFSLKVSFILLLLLFGVATFGAIYNWEFFIELGFLNFYGLFLLLGLSLWIFVKELKRVGAFLVLFVALLKFGFINFYAPIKSKKHPERFAALHFSKNIPKGTTIKYLPKRVDMELCAYIDLYTKGIVLRYKGSYFLTTKKELPQGKIKILSQYGNWVLGRF